MEKDMCIFCRELKDKKEFNKEHIILNSLGGIGTENIMENVCTTCNSILGTKVDSLLVNDEIIKWMRFLLKVKGRNGVPNPFNFEVKYADTPIVGKLQTNKEGDMIGFRASHKANVNKNNILIYGPKKDFDKYVQSQLKANNYCIKSEEEINNNLIDLDKPKTSYIEYIELPKELNNSCLENVFPAMLKMAYEFCFIKLGEKYLEDPVAIDISNSFKQLIINKDNQFNIPTNANLDYLKQPTSAVLLTLYTNGFQIYVEVEIYGLYYGNICMSKNAEKYVEIKKETLRIEIDSDVLERDILRFSDL